MDKGIRQGVKVKFAEMLPQLAELGGKKFRRIILDWTVEQYGCTMAAASTHYNHAFQETKKATPEKVVGLGRPPEKNKGGRKKEVKAVEGAAPAGDAAATPEGEAAAGTAVITDAAAGVGLEDLQAAAPETFTVVKAKDGSVVAEGLTREQAEELIAKAKAAKKGNLKIAE
jgi:hypothetical protein